MIQRKELYKQLINNIGEQIKKTLNEDLVTKQKNYTNKSKFYHSLKLFLKYIYLCFVFLIEMK